MVYLRVLEAEEELGTHHELAVFYWLFVKILDVTVRRLEFQADRVFE